MMIQTSKYNTFSLNSMHCQQLDVCYSKLMKSFSYLGEILEFVKSVKMLVMMIKTGLAVMYVDNFSMQLASI